MIKNKDRNAVRIIELPACKMVWSGACPGSSETSENEKLRQFCEWWGAADALRRDRFFARDFMWYDREGQGYAWGLALTEGLEDTGGYEVIDFPGGLYAVANYSGDAADVCRSTAKWIGRSGCFTADAGREGMIHFINTPAAAEAMGYGQYDLYLPIRVKEEK